MSNNLGQTSLKRRKRQADAMQAFDTLPAPLRQWLSNAALPWSPASVRGLWHKARAKGMTEEAALAHLTKCEVTMLRNDAVTQAVSSP